MCAGEMAGGPETLERKHFAQQSLSESWQRATGKKKERGKRKAR